MAQNERRKIKGWRSISAYVQRSERHLRRLHQMGMFPLYRDEQRPQAPVFAYEDELQAFLRKNQSLEKDLDPDIESLTTEIQEVPWPTQRKPGLLAWLGALVLSLVCVHLWLWPKLSGQNFLLEAEISHDSQGGRELKLLDQERRLERTIPMNGEAMMALEDQEVLRDYVVWLPELQGEPTIIEMVSAMPGAFVRHEWGRHPQTWLAPAPWLAEPPSQLVSLMRVNSESYEGLGLLWRHPQGHGSTFQLFDRNLALMAECYSERPVASIKCDRRILTFCFQDGSEHSFDVWDWIWQRGAIFFDEAPSGEGP